MAFTVRVELHKATLNEFNALHAVMSQAGFTRYIRDNQGVRYELPPGEYRYEAVSDLNTITNMAKAAAASTGRAYEVFVSEATLAMWFGLKKVPG